MARNISANPEPKPGPYLVVIGDPVDGFTFSGPFPTEAAASAWANEDAHLAGYNWWTAPLTAID